MPDETYTKAAIDSTSATNSGSHKIGFPAVAGIAGGIATKVYNAIIDLKAQIDALTSGKADSARGLPSGGATNEVLKKVNGTDYNVTWGSPSAVSDASTTVKGVSKSSTTPADSANPIHIESTDPKMSEGAAGSATVRSLGTGATQAAPGNDSRFTKYMPIEFFMSGGVSAKTGVGHDPVYPGGTVTRIQVSCDTAPSGGTLTATLVKEAGGAGGTATTIGSVTLAAASRNGTTTGLSVALSAGDTVRCDITTGTGYTSGSAKDLTAKGWYSY